MDEEDESKYLNEEEPVALEEVEPEEELDEDSKRQVERIQKDLDDQNINFDMEILLKPGRYMIKQRLKSMILLSQLKVWILKN